MIAALALLALGGALVPSAAPADGTTPAPTVALFNAHAGFAKARLGPIPNRHSITVGLAPEFWGDPQTVDDRVTWLDPVLDAWNRAAGWQVFVQVADDAVADVTFSTDAETACPPDAGGCAWMSQFGSGYFDHCSVAFWPWFPTFDAVAHELGHCLGFVDVPHPTPDGYRGIMMYGRAWGASPDNPFDRASLTAAGYRVAP